MTKAISHTYNFAFEYRMHISYALICSCMLMVLLYAMNVYAVVSHTVSLQRLESQSATLGTTVESLDAKYLELSSAITPDALHAYGLAQGQVSEFIQRTPSLGSVAMNGHEL